MYATTKISKFKILLLRKLTVATSATIYKQAHRALNENENITFVLEIICNSRQLTVGR